MSSEKCKEIGYSLNLNFLIISQYLHISYPREVGAELVASFLGLLTLLS